MSTLPNIVIKRKPNEPIERLTKRFKKAVSDSRIFQELRERSYFQKPSEKKRKKRARAEARRLKEAKLERERLAKEAKFKRDDRRKSTIEQRTTIKQW